MRSLALIRDGIKRSTKLIQYPAKPRSRRLRNPGQLRRHERYVVPLEGSKGKLRLASNTKHPRLVPFACGACSRNALPGHDVAALDRAYAPRYWP